METSLDIELRNQHYSIFPTLGLLTNIFLNLFWVNERDPEKSCVGHMEQHHKTLVKRIF